MLDEITDETDDDAVIYAAKQKARLFLYFSAVVILITAILARFDYVGFPIFFIVTGVMISLYLGIKMYIVYKSSDQEVSNGIFKWNYLNIIPKTLLFTIYHTLLFTAMFLLTYFLKPFVDFHWHWLVEWFRITIITVYTAGAVALAVMSILTCWNSKLLAEDEIGQISIGGWMPPFGKNQTNWMFGVFLGLPSIFVRMLSFSALAPKIVRDSPIQIPIHDDPEGKLFQADFLWSAKVRIANTKVYTLNRPKEAKIFKECKGVINKTDVEADWDIVNIVERRLTKWTNDRAREFTNVADVKPHKAEIEKMLNKLASKDLMDSHGIEFTEFFLESIEKPAAEIKQQIDDARQRAATIAREDREMIDNDSLIVQAKKLQEASRGDDGKVTMSWDKALEAAQVQQDKIRASRAKISGSGAGKGKRGGPGATVFLDGDGDD